LKFSFLYQLFANGINSNYMNFFARKQEPNRSGAIFIINLIVGHAYKI